MSFVERLHTSHIHGRRVRVLSNLLTDFIPQSTEVLDVGCGDGLLAHLVMQKRPDIKIRGIDVLVRSKTYLSVEAFDGTVIPGADKQFDVVMFVDVLHHTDDPMILLRQAVRVARKAIVIKDHICDGLFAASTLRLMDWVGNAHHAVSLPYNYWPQQKWLEAFNLLGLRISGWTNDLHLYPRPASWFFDRSLHFIARLDVKTKHEL
jgi:SAM-dependent methyltransferase